MCPERRRRTVESVRRTLGQEKVSERRVCRVLGQNRGTQRHRPRKVDGDRELLGVMRKIVETFPRHGSERTHRVLTGPEAFGGWKVNIKRVHRIWKEEHMQVPQKQRKRRRLPGSSANGCVRHRALHRNHVWSYDFLTERTEDGRQLRILVVIDEFTRECLAIEVARSFTARDVIMTLQYLFAVRGAPEHLRSGTAYFLSRILDDLPIEGLCSAEVGRDAQEILEAGLLSSICGERVSLPLAIKYS